MRRWATTPSTQGIKKMFILAPNYPAGTDSLNGFKRFYKGELVGEVYTKLGQTDYAAEIAQIRDSGADFVFFFLPGGMGIAFVKQYAQSGVGIPLMGPGFSFSQDVLGAIGDAALGAKNSASWSKDLDNAANKKFVEELPEGLQPAAVDLRRAGLRHREPDHRRPPARPASRTPTRSAPR